MPAICNLAGKRFGKLTVTHRLRRRDKHGRPLWRCKCACGRKTSLPACSLTTGNTTSCGCQKHAGNKRHDLAGKRFGGLVARELLDQRDKHGKLRWRCDCDCGKKPIVTANQLTTGKTKSCGCRNVLLNPKKNNLKCPPIITEAREQWYSASLTARKLRIDITTLYSTKKRTGWKEFCPLLDGEPLLCKPIRVGLPGRNRDYFHGPTVDRAEQAQKLTGEIKRYPGLVYVGDAAAVLKCSIKTLYRRLSLKRTDTTIRKPGTDANGKTRRYAYVPQKFLKAEGGAAAVLAAAGLADARSPAMPERTRPTAGAATKSGVSPKPAKLGRPAGRIDTQAADRNERIRRDHKARKFASIAELAKHHHVSRGRASNIIHGRD